MLFKVVDINADIAIPHEKLYNPELNQNRITHEKLQNDPIKNDEIRNT